MAIRDTEQIVKTCKACQFAAKHQRRSGDIYHSSSLFLGRYSAGEWTSLDYYQRLKAISSLPWLRSSISQKWIEARPVATITSATIRKFFWQQIIKRFGIPKELTVDNGK
jgi:hypothetical protein